MRALDGGGRYCEAEVQVTLVDVNDNVPRFTSDPYTITVFENSELHTPVAQLQATDLDSGNFFYSLLLFLGLINSALERGF